MDHNGELTLLCDTLRKLRISVALISSPDELNTYYSQNAFGIYSEMLLQNKEFYTIQPATMYKHTDSLRLNYIYFKTSDVKDNSIIFIGPYLSEPISSKELMELGERASIPTKALGGLERFYSSIPVISEGSVAFVMIDTFCEHVWGTPSFSIINTTKNLDIAVLPDLSDDKTLDARSMEMRYDFENELMEAVATGQLHKEKLLSGAFSDKMFEKRIDDPLKNAKNYCIIMNTLLRKAAERGGVHPLFIDKMSSEFAYKINQMSSLSENAPLMKDMFVSYCRLVQKHSTEGYSLTVKKVILLIDSDTSADLTLSSVASQLSVSPGYLSVLFKKETGKTLSEYVREKRMRYAAKLLATTKLQIQTIASHCGIMDTQYFSKLFKRVMGISPTEYREKMTDNV